MFSFIPNEYFLLAFGFILLIKGGDWFVDAATGIAKRFHLPELLIGATVVSIGTTLPEVMTSVIGAASNNGSAAFGNSIGSIICNTSLIAALTIAIKPGKADRKTLIFPVCFFFGAAALFSTFSYVFESFERWMGIVLLCGFVAYMVINVINMKKNPTEQESDEAECELPDGTETEATSFIKDIAVLIGAIAVIAIGADLAVSNIGYVALSLGVPPSVVNTTILALATSLPELVTAITALAKGHGALSLGNIIGANIFNIVLVSGASITINPFDVPVDATFLGMNASLLFTLPLAVVTMMLLTIPPLFRGKLARWQGIVLLGIYGLYCVLLYAILPNFK